MMTLRLLTDGNAVVYDHAGAPIACIEPTPSGIRIHAGVHGAGTAVTQFGRADDPGPTIAWTGEPFTMTFELTPKPDN